MPFSVDGRNVLIYGAGDGGEMILRELKSNPDWNCKPVGFIDDDPFKKGKLIHGLRVFGGNGSLQTICRENDVREILISCQKISPGRLKEVKEICQRAEISLKRAQLKIEPVDFE
jgi:UDP-GlcNAc:undecaprenyl-phosphate GlcNAc-1-phosphate transferase